MLIGMDYVKLFMLIEMVLDCKWDILLSGIKWDPLHVHCTVMQHIVLTCSPGLPPETTTNMDVIALWEPRSGIMRALGQALRA